MRLFKLFFGLLVLIPVLSMDAQAISIAAFGDSITRGVPYHSNDANGLANDGGYVPYLQSQLNAVSWGLDETVTIYNWGHPGELVTAGGRDRFPSPVLNANPDYVLVMEGTNDLPWGIGPGAVNDKLDSIMAEVLGAGLIPVIGTLLPRFDKNSWVNIQGVNSGVFINAAKRDVEVADLYHATPNWQPYLNSDKLHPTLTGYALMANVWFATLEDIGPVPDPVPPVAPMIYELLLSD